MGTSIFGGSEPVDATVVTEASTELEASADVGVIEALDDHESPASESESEGLDVQEAFADFPTSIAEEATHSDEPAVAEAAHAESEETAEAAVSESAESDEDISGLPVTTFVLEDPEQAAYRQGYFDGQDCAVIDSATGVSRMDLITLIEQRYAEGWNDALELATADVISAQLPKSAEQLLASLQIPE